MESDATEPIADRLDQMDEMAHAMSGGVQLTFLKVLIEELREARERVKQLDADLSDLSGNPPRFGD